MRAFYQNMRGRALFSEKQHVLLEEPSGIEILDPVRYEYTDSDDEKARTSGIYVVSAKTIYVTNGSMYNEKLELIRPSLIMAGNTPLIGA